MHEDEMRALKVLNKELQTDFHSQLLTPMEVLDAITRMKSKWVVKGTELERKRIKQHED